MHVGKSTTPQEGPAVRERLLTGALQLFISRGYAATSVREIVEAAGVTKPVLYYYFQSKEGLYLAIMEQAYGIFERRVAEITDSPGTIRERLQRFCLGMFDAFTEHLPIVRLIYAIYFGPPQGAPYYNLDQFYERMLEIIEEMVRAGVASGELRQGNSNDMTWAVISALNTTMEEQLCQASPRIDRDGLGRVLNLILDGLAGGANQ
jgi:TetR/AcrR family transcriptional regulator